MGCRDQSGGPKRTIADVPSEVLDRYIRSLGGYGDGDIAGQDLWGTCCRGGSWTQTGLTRLLLALNARLCCSLG